MGLITVKIEFTIPARAEEVADLLLGISRNVQGSTWFKRAMDGTPDNPLSFNINDTDGRSPVGTLTVSASPAKG